MEPFADVFEGIGVGPADADRFFGEDHGLLAPGVDGIFNRDPVDLVRGEKTGEEGGAVELEEGKEGGHN